MGIDISKCGAIDPGIANTGFACGECKCSFTYKTKPTYAVQQRLSETVDRLTNHVKACGLRSVIIEDTFGLRIKTTNFQIGAFLSKLSKQKTQLVAPSKWVRDLWGRSNAGKYKEKAMSLSVSLGWKPKSQHEADAICLLHWFTNMADNT